MRKVPKEEEQHRVISFTWDFHPEAATALPSALRLCCRNSYILQTLLKKFSGLKTYEWSASLHAMHDECLHGLSITQREWGSSSSPCR